MRQGFSLIELSLVIIIIALVIGGSLTMGPVLLTHTKYRISDQKMAELVKAFERYYETQGRLPCPAAANIASGNSAYGDETTCHGQTSVSGVTYIANSGNPVFIGAVPVNALYLEDGFTHDEFDQHLLYAVMDNMTDADDFPDAIGAITVNDGTAVDILTDAAFVLISHGDNGRGATTIQGNATAEACSGSALDVENCDGDVTFTEARISLKEDTANAFDDIIYWSDKDTILYSKTVRWKDKLGEQPAHCRVTSQTKIVSTDLEAGDQFAYATAIDGDTAIMTARGEDTAANAAGAAYVFVCKSDGTWAQQAKLTADDAAANDLFGQSAAISGNRIVIGALRGDAPSAADSGSAYVFVRNGNSWSQEAELLASDATSGDEFGRSVDIDGDTVIVGARLNDTVDTNAGAVYIFDRIGNSWTETTKLTPSDLGAGDQIGFDVAIDGHTAAITAHGYDTTPTESPANTSATGAAYIFRRDSGGWSEQAKLIANDAAANDQMGYAIDIRGDNVIVGAPLDNSSAGSAYVFNWDGSSWTEEDRLSASDGAAGDQFGREVEIENDTILVGAYLADDGATSTSEAGKAYYYSLSAGSWSQQGSAITASDAGASEAFTIGMALGENYSIIGAYADDDNFSNAGAAYAQPLP